MKPLKLHDNILRVGIVGYSAQKFDEEQAMRLIYRGMEKIVKNVVQNKDKEISIEIVSGLTDLGIPALAYKFAKQHNLYTVGVACSKATEYECYPVDKRIIVGSNWGDESQDFLKYCDAFIRVGGGNQSHKEMNLAREMKKPIVEFDLPALDK